MAQLATRSVALASTESRPSRLGLSLRRMRFFQIPHLANISSHAAMPHASGLGIFRAYVLLSPFEKILEASAVPAAAIVSSGVAAA